MAGFQFKLEPVLKHRQMIEDQNQREMAQLLRRQLILQTQLRNLQQTITDDKRSIADALVGNVDVTQIRRHGIHSNQLTLRIQMIAVELLKLNQQIDIAQNILIDAMKSRKAVEILREKQLKRWQSERQRRQISQIDEFTTQAYIRRHSRHAREMEVAV